MSLSADSLLAALQPWLAAPRWWLGLSGGLDSTVLLHLLAQLRERGGIPPLGAIHINHQLSRHAQDWSEHCQSCCERLDVPLRVRSVAIDLSAGKGLEAAAREARYRVFDELLGVNELLLLGHHLDDQVETFFQRLLRGAGAHGLAAMPVQRGLGRGHLLRPLLDIPRAALEELALRDELRWVEDDSNRDQSLERNFLRHSVLPLIEQRWPGYRHSIRGSIQALAADAKTLRQLDVQRLEAATTAYRGLPVLDLQRLDALDLMELCRLLRHWLMAHGKTVPGRDRLREFARQLLDSAEDRAPLLRTAHLELRLFRRQLHLLPPLADPDGNWRGQLEPGGELLLPQQGRLMSRRLARGTGLAPPRAGIWSVRLRQGGERARPTGRAHSQSLKKLLQEQAVPPWWRERLPLLFDGEELAAVADLWPCEGHRRQAGEMAYEILWQPNFPARPD